MANSKRNNIEVKLIRGNHRISNSTKPDIESYKKLVIEGGLREEIVKPGLLISRLDNPEDIAYGDERIIRLSPRQKVKVANVDKVGKLAKGIFLKKLFKNQEIPKELLKEDKVKVAKKSKRKKSKKKS